jgi:hypothetical protein
MGTKGFWWVIWWEQEDFDSDCLRTWWEQKDFDGFIDGNKKKLMRTIWELDAEEKIAIFAT